jgi:hypothetical protein
VRLLPLGVRLPGVAAEPFVECRLAGIELGQVVIFAEGFGLEHASALDEPSLPLHRPGQRRHRLGWCIQSGKELIEVVGGNDRPAGQNLVGPILSRAEDELGPTKTSFMPHAMPCEPFPESTEFSSSAPTVTGACSRSSSSIPMTTPS